MTLLGKRPGRSRHLRRSIGANEWADGELAHGEAAFDPVAAQLSAEGADRDHRVEVIVGNDRGGVFVGFPGGLGTRSGRISRNARSGEEMIEGHHLGWPPIAFDIAAG
ncbi:MAG: hypothetical protein M3066_01570 [Actinomycetota bacterium]|nr:hypothetical protein [Actinomycetota bacterium]